MRMLSHIIYYYFLLLYLSVPNRQKIDINTETSKENCTKQMQQNGIRKSVEKQE